MKEINIIINFRGTCLTLPPRGMIPSKHPFSTNSGKINNEYNSIKFFSTGTNKDILIQHNSPSMDKDQLIQYLLKNNIQYVHEDMIKQINADLAKVIKIAELLSGEITSNEFTSFL